MTLLSNRGRVAYRQLRPPKEGRTLSHDTGEYGYQYKDGLTITNTSLATAELMAQRDCVAFHMRTWRRYKRDGYPPS